MRLAALVCLLALALAGQARADDVDTEAARRHFNSGLELYGLEHYAEAIKEFEQARAIKPLPAFDYNIGRSCERAERWADAIAAYERFLAVAPPFAQETTEIRERVGVLRGRIAHPRAVRVAPSRALRILAPVTIGVAAAALIGGTGAYLSVYPDYADAKAACGPHCSLAQVSGLWTRVERAQSAGIALWSIGGALALASVPMFLLSRGPEPARRYAVVPSIGTDHVALMMSGTLP